MMDTKHIENNGSQVFEDETMIAECLEMFDACVKKIEADHEVTGKSA